MAEPDITIHGRYTIVEDCWLWNKPDNNGYGQVRIRLGNNSMLVTPAHRISYQLFKGMIPPNLVLDHLCRNRACINPDHLEPVTQKINVQRGLLGQITHCVNGHEYNEQTTYVRKDRGTRACKVCMGLANKRYMNKKAGITRG